MAIDEIQEDGTRRVTVNTSGRETISILPEQPTEIVFDLDAMLRDRLRKLAVVAIVAVVLVVIGVLSLLSYLM